MPDAKQGPGAVLLQVRRGADRPDSSLQPLRRVPSHGQQVVHLLRQPTEVTMASKGPDQVPQRPSGLQAMLARLRGMAESLTAEKEEAMPNSNASIPEAAPVDIPEATPV